MIKRNRFSILLVFCLIIIADLPAAGAQGPTTGPAGPNVLQPQIGLLPFASGLSQPTVIAFSGVPGDDRIFVAERDGAIRLLDAQGNRIGTSFMNIDDKVLYGQFSEQGLLGMVFDPDYENNGYFYLHYTAASSTAIAESRISRFQVTSSDPNIADPTSEEILLTVDQPGEVHNGGAMAFGPDGYLYIGLGDGMGNGDEFQNAQNLSLPLGKILRIDVTSTLDGSSDCKGEGTGGYVVPSSNPFVDGGSGGNPAPGPFPTPNDNCDEIWVLGLRNPWRFSFDRSSGDLFIGDVGELRWEEINIQEAGDPGGENFGWPCYEGNHLLRLPPNTPPNCNPPDPFVFPDHEYAHISPATPSAVIGGHVYRGSVSPTMAGLYVFADYGGRFWSARLDGANFITRLQGKYKWGWSSFGEAPDGELYLANQNTGKLYRLIALPLDYHLPMVVKNP